MPLFSGIDGGRLRPIVLAVALALLLLARAGPGSTTVVDGLTAPIAIDVTPDGALVVLEFAHGFAPGQPVGFAPCSGRLLRIVSGRREVVADGLHYPTDVVVDRAGGYYVTIGGAFGPGKVVRLAASAARPDRAGRCLR